MTVTVSASNSDFRVPDDLTERDQWVLWRHESRHGKATKVPYQASGKPADSTNPSTWAIFEDVQTLWRKNPRRYAGLGFVFSKEDPFAGIDLDDSLDEHGRVKPWAHRIVERFGDTYMEISPSSLGLKIWARGSLPSIVPGVRVGDGQIELYDRARYFTVTGRVFRGAPLQVEDHAADLLALFGRPTDGRNGWPLQPLLGGRIPYGRQHNTLVSICGSLRARRVCEEAIEACLQVVNQKQCEIPGAPEDIRRIVDSSRRWVVV